jgi:hypothetical protein
MLGMALACVVLCPEYARAQGTCDDQAQKAAEEAKAKGLPQAQVDRAYGTALLQCKGVKDASLAAVAAAINLDYARLARLFLARKLTTADYLQLVRDRSAKLRLARGDSAYRAAWLSGDADSDFVPDDRDKCPRSADLAATGRDGCPAPPSRTRVPGEDAMAQARRALRGIALVSNPACADAPVPDRSILLHQGFLRPDGNLAHHFYGVAVSRVRNAPQGCDAFYQFHFRFSDRTDATFPPTKIIQVTFADGENTDTGPKAPVRRIFKVFLADTGHRKDLFQSAVKYGRVDWRVRTIGGNGLMSTWSEWRHEPFNGVFRPDGP